MKELPMAAPVPNRQMSEDERQLTLGLGFCHSQLDTLAQQVVDAAAEVGALAGTLQARGMITEEELAAYRKQERERIVGVLSNQNFGIAIAEEFPDKYAISEEQVPHIECEERYHLCRGACCALRFPLSAQDLNEGIVRWELGNPYLIRQGPDQRCVHQDRATLHCSIYEHRPGICRVYDCRGDKRIWVDFERRIINPDLFATGPDGAAIPHFPKTAMGEPPPEKQVPPGG
jgi:Fe-S-cluster containining protein